MDLIIVFLIIFGQQITIIITIPIHPKLVGFVSFYDIYKQVSGNPRATHRIKQNRQKNHQK